MASDSTSSTQPSLPHLSPPSSIAPHSKQLAKRKRAFPFFGKKTTPHTTEPGSEEDEDEPGVEHSRQLREAAVQGKGPNLRLLPTEEGSVLQSNDASVSAKASRYVALPESGEAQPHEGKGSVKYEWDYVMEHQRGIVWFNTPYFSTAGLLQFDPPPYTTLRNGPNSKPIPCSLEDYQLPNPSWAWAGEGWCVDMRGDGEVQEDGFEYNWAFGRRRGWKPTMGVWGAGAWVRRRRWMRLRYLADPMSHEEERVPGSLTSDVTIKPPGEKDAWQDLRRQMKEAELDRERLHVWADWLAAAKPEDEALLREHLSDALGFFVYPRSRAAFRELVHGKGWSNLPLAEERVFWSENAPAVPGPEAEAD